MNPLPCSVTARAKLPSAAASDASRRPPGTIHRRRDPRETRRPLPSPTASPTAIPTASSRRALPSGEWPDPVTPSWLAATTRVKATMGVTMPSLRPLSTLRARRSRSGIFSSLTTWALRAASVGASVAATKQTRASERSSKHHAATIAPSTSVRGRPIPSSRAGRPMSLRSRNTSTRAASAKSRSASVPSARTCTDGASTSTERGPQSGLATRYPAAVKTSAPVMLALTRRPDTTAQPRIRSVMTAKAVSDIVSSSDLRTRWVPATPPRPAGAGCAGP